MPSFQPKLVTTLREGYGLSAFRKDAIAGLTVAIVALPLSLAIAIASHAPPQAGLYAAIIGGFLISALGGSRFQIGGPAGAFIVLVASTIDAHGLDGLLLASAMAGCLMIMAGVVKLGSVVRRVPHEVTVGFTAGIGIIILASQLHDFFGLKFSGKEPGPLLEKLGFFYLETQSVSLAATMLAVLTVALVMVLRRVRPNWPSLLVAVLVTTLASLLFHLPVETIGDRFGEIPQGLAMPRLPQLDWALVLQLLPSAFAIAALGSIESLLSAVVADKMADRQHRPNTELVAQGVANLITPLFGGLTVTGTIARTATNVRAGAHGPVSGMLHAAFLLLFMLVAAPVLSYVPLATLAGVLALVALGMLEWQVLARHPRWQSVMVIAMTLLVVIFRDLVEGIAVGIAVHVLLHFVAPPRR
jgi:sulfate permease, SulP family